MNDPSPVSASESGAAPGAGSVRNAARSLAIAVAATLLMALAGGAAIYLLHRTMKVPGSSTSAAGPSPSAGASTAGASDAATAPGGPGTAGGDARPVGGPDSPAIAGAPPGAESRETAPPLPSDLPPQGAGITWSGQPRQAPPVAGGAPPVSLRVPVPGAEPFDPGRTVRDPARASTDTGGARGPAPPDARGTVREPPRSSQAEVLRSPSQASAPRPGGPRDVAAERRAAGERPAGTAAPGAATASPPGPAAGTDAQAKVQPAPARPPAAATPQRLAEAQQAQCGGESFLGRFVCDERVRLRFCRDRWNAHPDCIVEASRNNQQYGQ